MNNGNTDRNEGMYSKRSREIKPINVQVFELPNDLKQMTFAEKNIKKHANPPTKK